MSDTNNGGNFLPGFLLGAVLGSGIIFLFGTKKGKILLKTITEEGLEGISEVEDIIEEVAEEYETPEVLEKKLEPQVNKEQVVEEKSSGVKRFFRGIRKKV